MTTSSWFIVIGGPLILGGYVGLLAYLERSWAEIAVVGIVFTSAALMLNYFGPPLGAILLFGFLTFCVGFTLLAVWRERKPSCITASPDRSAPSTRIRLARNVPSHRTTLSA